MKEKKEGTIPLINEQIRFPRVQVINARGENLGVLSCEDALKQAMLAQLDLVLLAPEGVLGEPVVKIMDFGKALYERKKKKSEAKKNQKTVQVKEIKVRPKIGEHDYLTKVKQIIQFLKEGKKTKITLSFRGRENALKDVHGAEFFAKLEQTLDEHSLTKNLVKEGDMHQGHAWSRVYFLKSTK